MAGLKIVGCHNNIYDIQSYGYETGIDMVNSHGNIFVGETILDTRQVNNKKTGRNSPCPCGSGIKFKRCHGYGGYMSTGIRSDNSTFIVGKATIVADIGVDLKNGSNGHINELNHISPLIQDLAGVLKSLPVQPPVNLVQDAITHQRTTGTIEGSELRTWFDEQGVNLAFWAQLVVAIAAMV
ncbi:YecA family protein [Pseudomonas orientalis]|uniref:YecA family protein n=1 Tax=Pseudomonas orientalis TaxID=76758 RepID=UPI0034D3CD6E